MEEEDATNIDLYTFDELDRLVQEFQEESGNPMPVEENRIEYSFQTKDENWEDLEVTEDVHNLRHSKVNKAVKMPA